MSLIKDFLRSKKIDATVFKLADFSMAVDGYSGSKLRFALKYAVAVGDLYRISKGIYALSTEYSRLEFANKYRSPSYVSLYTVLAKEGVVFQPYSSIYLVGDRSEELEVDGQKYIYRQLKNEILLNPLGVKNEHNVQIASAERAICDKIYLDGDEYFDNLRRIDWELMRDLNQQVYGSNMSIAAYIDKNCKLV